MSEFIILGSDSVERQHLMARATVQVEEAMNELLARFIVENSDEINERLADFGITVDRLLQPEWQVSVRAKDLELWGSPEQKRDAVVDMMARVNESIRRNEELAAKFGRTAEESAR